MPEDLHRGDIGEQTVERQRLVDRLYRSLLPRHDPSAQNLEGGEGLRETALQHPNMKWAVQPHRALDELRRRGGPPALTDPPVLLLMRQRNRRLPRLPE